MLGTSRKSLARAPARLVRGDSCWITLAGICESLLSNLRDAPSQTASRGHGDKRLPFTERTWAVIAQPCFQAIYRREPLGLRLDLKGDA